MPYLCAEGNATIEAEVIVIDNCSVDIALLIYSPIFHVFNLVLIRKPWFLQRL